MPDILLQIEEWKKRLIDLTRRNQLVFFNTAKKNILEITRPTFKNTFDRLVNEKKLNVWLPPEEEEDDETPKEESLFVNDQPEQLEKEINFKESDVVFSLDSRKETERRLKTIYRKAISDYNEKGIRTSVIAFGLLWWKEKGTKEKVCSPLILFPIEIEQASPKESYKIFQSDEDIVLNPAIQVKLNWDFNIQLPQPDFDSEDWDIDQFFRSIEQLGRQGGWTIENKMFLGNFSFHKMAMYYDLSTNASLMSEHPIIEGLAKGSLGEKLCSECMPDEKELDKNADPQRMLYVLDADSSQSKAIEAAMAGHSFVLKGPPGTGKSQTISNIIAEMLEHGKTILFVSEKMAALEVVFNRLKQAKLTDYCLELHSHKVNKKEVIKELVRCLDEQPVAKQRVSRAEFEQLRSLRDTLNDYVIQLHCIREPLGESMYQVFGRLAKRESTPLIAINLPNDSYDPSNLQHMKDLISRLRNNIIVLKEGERFPWVGFKAQRFTPTLRTGILNLLEKLRLKINKLESLFRDCAATYHLDYPKSTGACQWLLQICNKLVTNPSPNKLWFSEAESKELSSEAKKYCELDSDYNNLKGALLSEFKSDFFNLPKGTRESIEDLWNNAAKLLSREIDIDKKLVSDRKGLETFLENSKGYLESFVRDTKEISDSLTLPLRDTCSIERVEQIAEIAILMFATDKPEKTWLDPIQLNKARDEAKILRGYCEKHSSILANLKLKYGADYFTLNFDRLTKDFSTKYKSVLRYVNLHYYVDINRIKKLSKDGRLPSSYKDDLVKAKELKDLEVMLKSDIKIKESLGSYYNDFDTNIEAVESAMEVARKIIQLVGELPLPPAIVSSGSLGGVASPGLITVAKRLQKNLSEWKAEIEKYGDLIASHRLVTTKLSINESPITLVRKHFEDTSTAIKAFNSKIDSIEITRVGGEFSSYSELEGKLSSLDKIKEFEEKIKNSSESLSRLFGSKFHGLTTNWREIIDALNWTAEFMEITKSVILPDEFIDEVVGGISIDSQELKDLETEYGASLKVIQEFENNYDHKQSYYLESHPISALSFDEIIAKIKVQTHRIDDLAYWLDYVSAASEMKKVGLEEFLKKLVCNPPSKESIEDIFFKAYYSSWANKICDEIPILGEFRGSNHENAITDFRQLDKKLNILSASLIIQELNDSRKGLLEGIRGGEISTLRDQNARVRRHLPLRLLFSRIPGVLLKIKPCLLMSPLSVSHFIDQNIYKFDVVIFDEASQICSEDAVGAIARGKQLVVAGDNRQLPPTKFFQGDYSDDEEAAEDSEELFGIYQSVLDDCERIGLIPQPLMLKWHYRSKHEALIAYSNQKFYESKLVTFPCAKESHIDLGIKFVHVPDGIFDRGGKRNNLKEAEVVADLVFEHFTKFGESKTLGVATLNIPQRDTVMDAIEQRRKNWPEMDKYFLNDRLSGFFVKNLEAVQGDERDVIILSLGYGRDSHGKFTMNFGPINKEGGEKRLNVIVTRAKEKLVLVSSIKAGDFDLNSLNTAGVRHLYHYLDYAERGKEALELGSVVDGDIDSPFEEEVKNEIRSLGYSAVSQVGCSGFRIDIGVIDPANPGCFILGVECDGATYHQAFTARERDRIRQEVLEGLGWRIHRVWSPDWFFRRSEEAGRLKAAIEKAQHGGYCSGAAPITHEVGVSYHKREPQEFGASEVEGIIEYVVYRRRPYTTYEFCLPETDDRRVQVMCEIVKAEEPIHMELAIKRLLAAWNIGRMGSNVEKTVNHTIRTCLKLGYIYKKGKFLYSNLDCTTENVRKPIDSKPETFRDPEFISEEEMGLALTLLIKSAFSIEEEALFTEVSRLFGWERRGAHVMSAISKAFSNLIENGQVRIQDGRVTIIT